MLVVKNLSKNFGQRELFHQASFSLFPKEKVCLMAPNGSGKTTLLKILLQEDTEYDGDIEILNKVQVLAVRQQLPNSDLGLLDFVIHNLPVYQEYKKLMALEHRVIHHETDQEILNQYGEQQIRFEQMGGFSYLYEAKKILEGLGFKESEKDFERPIHTFSGGEIRRALLVEILVQKPDILILDEPTNHLDLKNILFLEGFLKRYKGAILFVSHDTEFINNISTHTMSIEEKKLIKVKGGYPDYLEHLADRKKLYEKKQKELEVSIEKLQPNIEKFRAGTRSTQAQSMQKRLQKLKQELQDYKVYDKYTKPISFQFKPYIKPFDPVLKINNLNFSIDPRSFFRDLNLTVRRGEKIAILAPNGSGKSLLIHQIMEANTHKSSQISFGQGVEVGFFRQKDEHFSSEYSSFTCLEYLQELFSASYTETEYHKYLGRFNLPDTRISSLSGGEQSKLRLLSTLLKNPNVLILDEPTNHLDIPSINGISSILKNYKGSLILVTHNRQLLKELNPEVYLLKNQQLHSMSQKSWGDIFQQLMLENVDEISQNLETNAQQILEELSNNKEDLKQVESKPWISKELQKELRQVQKKIQKVILLIEQEENLLSTLEAQQFDESIYTDLKKAQELQENVVQQRIHIENLYEEYSHLEEYKKQLE